MSAYIVDRDHILFLVTTAHRIDHGTFANRVAQVLTLGQCDTTISILVAACNELARENIRSIEGRYPDTAGRPENAPGDHSTYEPFYASELRDAESAWLHTKPVDVLSSAAGYEYQSCETGEAYYNSKAAQILDLIRRAAIRALPGYDNGPWGAPERNEDKLIRLGGGN